MEEKFIDVRKSGTEWKIPEGEFKRRYRELFYDPWFDKFSDQIEDLCDVAYKAYLEGRKAPRTVKAGTEFADPEYDLSIEWLRARDAIRTAERDHAGDVNRILLISAAHRNDHTCPGEISKSYRLMLTAKETLIAEGFEVEVLELDKLSSEYGKKIHPCKACVSTAMPLCHWPCSCYPNHSLGQVQDIMNEIYPMWVRAHGIMIITPVYWHQSPSALKLMMDRLVCADGGNPDPTTTQGKDPAIAKKLELEGWSYPRHLRGRCFSVVVHGDTMGVDDAKSALCDWLEEMELIPSGNSGNIGRYIGYFEPYATSHDSLDRDKVIFKETENSAKALCDAVRVTRQKGESTFLHEEDDPRPK